MQADLQINLSFGHLPNSICLSCVESHHSYFLNQKSWFDETKENCFLGKQTHAVIFSFIILQSSAVRENI